MNKGQNIAYIGMLDISEYSTVGDLINEMATSINTALGVTLPNDFEQIIEYDGGTYILLPLPDGTFATEGCSVIGINTTKTTTISDQDYNIVFGYHTNNMVIKYFPYAYFKPAAGGFLYESLKVRPGNGCALMLDTTFMDYGIMALGGCQRLTNKQPEPGTVIQPVYFSIIADNDTCFAICITVNTSYRTIQYLVPNQLELADQMYRINPLSSSYVQIMTPGAFGLKNSKLKIICNFENAILREYFYVDLMTTVGNWYKDGITIDGKTYLGTLTAGASAIFLIEKPSDNS